MSQLGASSSKASPCASANLSQNNRKSYSCVLCAQRKVRCDRNPGGCANCTKARVNCIYKPPPPPRRRKKGDRDVDTAVRLRIYEDALRQLRVDPEALVKQGLSTGTAYGAGTALKPFFPSLTGEARHENHVKPEAGVLVTDEGRSRYLENGIWTSLQSEFRAARDILEDSSDDDSPEPEDGMLEGYSPNSTRLLFRGPISPAALRTLHPEPVQIFKLWQSYLENINPLVKVFHAPTVQQLISDASGDLGNIARNVEALLFAIYSITTESLSDGECLVMLGQSKSAALQRFRAGAQYSLTNANLLRSSDLVVLQAFTLFILSLQNFDARIIWIWSGIAQRIGQRIGLHRDPVKLGLLPFDVEIRRRLWWQIMMLEGYAQKLAGTGTAGTILMGDVNMPANVNDSDLFIGMKEPPPEHEGASEMMFFLIRCHVGEFLKRSAETHTTFDGVWNKLTTSAVHVAIKDKAITELEALFEQKFLQYCDPSIPWHLMCSQLGKAIIFMMRFMAHSTEHYKTDMREAEKDLLFDLALQVTAAQNLAYTMKEMQGFMWHVNLHFQWKAFVYLLSELRYRFDGPVVDKAWEEVAKAHDFHPSFDKELALRALPVAVSNLTLKAWDAYIAHRGVPPFGEPYFIQVIRHRQSYPKASKEPAHLSATTTPDISTEIFHSKGGLVDSHIKPGTDPLQALEWTAADFNASLGVTSNLVETVPLDRPESLDWATWDNLLVDFQTAATEEIPIDLSAFDFGLQ